MFQELTKGQDAEHPQLMPEDLSSAITGQLPGMAGVNSDALNKLGQALTEFVQSTIDQPVSMEQEHEGSESNEYLCASAQKSDETARGLLLDKNVRTWDSSAAQPAKCMRAWRWRKAI